MTLTDETYHAPKIRPIVFGIILFILFLTVMCSLSDLVKFIGYPFLWVPEKLGLIQVIHPDDVTTIHMADGGTSTVNFTAPGWYQVYINDYDLLLASDDLANRGGKPWINARTPSGESAAIAFISRGLRPYDSPFAKGRPVLAIQVTELGDYQLRHPSKAADFSIVPDYSTGNEFTIYFFYALEIGLLLLPFAYLIRRSRVRLTQRVQSVKQLKRIDGNDFWKREINRQKDAGPQKPKNPNPAEKWW